MVTKSMDLKCAVCFCEEHEVNLADIIESAVEQWAQIAKHEKHSGGASR